MTFRLRLAAAAAAAVAAAIGLVAFVTYVVVRNELRGGVDSSLRARAETLEHIPLRIRSSADSGRFFLDIPPPVLGAAPGYVQLVGRDGVTARSDEEGDVALPVDDRTREVASGAGSGFYSDTHVAGVHVRMITLPLTDGFALQIARPLTEVDHALARMKLWLLLAGLGGIGLSAVLGLGVARTALAPVRRLTEATEDVTETRNLGSRIEVSGRDELTRLAASFNTMLGALEQSVRAQHQLVADASHELRTPLTSVRTNVDVLASEAEMTPSERTRLVNEVVEQLAEMSDLVSELVELARGEQRVLPQEDVRLDQVVADAIERTRRNSPHVDVVATLEPTTVHGVRSTIERAVGNLLDNAAKWSPAGGRVEVSVAEGKVEIRDHGPGIAEEDLPYVFDRFYRAAASRGLPGSGLGLAIVRQVAHAHGGEVVAEHADGGGTRMRLLLTPTG